jgi:sensor histidine kinase YesM
MRPIFPKILSHVAAWLAFLAVPALVLPRPPRMLPPQPPSHQGVFEPIQVSFFILMNLLLIIFFYLNYLIFIPRLWIKQRKWAYFASIVGSFLILQLLVVLLSRVLMPRLMPGLDNMMIQKTGNFASLVMFCLIWASSSGIRLSQEWKKAEERRRESENTRLNAELAQLKTQLNPHFLFNTLNGIYTLALSKHEAAPDAVLKLSHLLRYVMADTSTDFVPLEDDLEHLRHFIELHQMRLTEQTPVSFRVTGPANGHQIAPLLLLPFVENAFKFGISTREPSPIHIEIQVENNHLAFYCQNHTRVKSDHSIGIGVANTRRRLELLYPERYSLEMIEIDGVFRVSLKLWEIRKISDQET